MAHLVVAGAGLAGLRAVEAARRSGFEGTITLIGDEPYPPYDRPPLSKELLTGEATGPRFFRSADSLRRDLRVELLLSTAVTALHADERIVIAGGKQIRYTGLVIATGARARDLPGSPRLAGLHTLRTVEDGLALRQALRPGSRVVVIGAGFIGSEVACSARLRGSEVTVVEAAPVPLAHAVGDVAGALLWRLHESIGTDLRCGAKVESIEGTAHVEAVNLSDGSRLPADVVVAGVGAVPAIEWLQRSGLELNNGVVCDETLNAGAPGVYAAGDGAEWFNPLFGETMRLEHWSAAADQGRVAGRNAADPSLAAPCATVPYFWSDWNGDRIQFAGVPGADEVEVVAGDPAEGSFLVLYRRGGRVCGVLGLNQAQPVIQLRAMIARRVSWPEALEFANQSAISPGKTIYRLPDN